MENFFFYGKLRGILTMYASISKMLTLHLLHRVYAPAVYFSLYVMGSYTVGKEFYSDHNM